MAHSPAPSTYNDCVACLRTSLTLLESSVDTLGSGVSDFPRLGSVLKTVRVSSSVFWFVDKRKENKRKEIKTKVITSTTNSSPNPPSPRQKPPSATRSAPSWRTSSTAPTARPSARRGASRP